MNCFTDIIINASAFPYCFYDDRKIILHQDHIRRTFCHFCTMFPHGTANICRFQGRGIIDTIPRHGNHFAAFLKCLYDTHFMARGNAGKYCTGFCRLLQFIIGHFLHFLPCDDAVTCSIDTQLSCNGLCGQGMVACDHNRADACFPAGFHSGFCFRSGRVHHPSHACENQVFFQSLCCKEKRFFLPFPKGNRNNTESVRRHFPIFHIHLTFSSVVEGCLPFSIQTSGAFFKQHFRRTLCYRKPFITAFVYRCHQFSFRGKRHFPHTGHLLPQSLQGNAPFFRRLDKGFFCRLCQNACPFPACITAQGKQCQDKPSFFFILFQTIPYCRKSGHFHAVLGQRACFI